MWSSMSVVVVLWTSGDGFWEWDRRLVARSFKPVGELTLRERSEGQSGERLGIVVPMANVPE